MAFLSAKIKSDAPMRRSGAHPLNTPQRPSVLLSRCCYRGAETLMGTAVWGGAGGVGGRRRWLWAQGRLEGLWRGKWLFLWITATAWERLPYRRGGVEGTGQRKECLSGLVGRGGVLWAGAEECGRVRRCGYCLPAAWCVLTAACGVTYDF